MRACTQKCREHGQLEISFHCDDAPALAPGRQWFLQWIEDEVAGGRRFLPEQTVQVGWSVLQIHQRTDGTLALFEPDFQSMPVKFIDGVTNTLRHLLLQKSVAESLGLEAELAIPSLGNSAIVCTEFGSTDGFVMSRVTAKGTDSGWFCGCNNPAHDHQSPDKLRRISLYEAAVRHEDGIVPFLALPADIFVWCGKPAPSISRAGKKLEFRPGSYLQDKYGAR